MTAGAPPSIRPAVPQDAEALARVHLQAWAETYQGLLSDEYLATLSIERRLDSWRRTLADPTGTTVLADPGVGELAGFASTRPGQDGDPAETELWGIYLLAGWHGRGLGRMLLDAATGGRPCFLWVAEQNLGAQAFYRRNGFRPDGAGRNLDWMEQLGVVRMVR